MLKGERGPRSGNYLMIFEIDSLEARNRLYPEEGHTHQEENERFDLEQPESAATWQRLSAMTVDLAVATDYVVIAE